VFTWKMHHKNKLDGFTAAILYNLFTCKVSRQLKAIKPLRLPTYGLSGNLEKATRHGTARHSTQSTSIYDSFITYFTHVPPAKVTLCPNAPSRRSTQNVNTKFHTFLTRFKLQMIGQIYDLIVFILEKAPPSNWSGVWAGSRIILNAGLRQKSQLPLRESNLCGSVCNPSL
jgi:hypothetical protein